MLVKEGYVRPEWFTTEYRITDAEYRYISEADFHLARANDEVLAHIDHGGNFVGFMKQSFETALAESRRGVLVVGPQELVAQVARAIPRTLIFALKETQMQLSPHLARAEQRGQLHRLDVDVLVPGAWSDVHRTMVEVLDR
jgi:guanylate kinase